MRVARAREMSAAHYTELLAEKVVMKDLCASHTGLLVCSRRGRLPYRGLFGSAEYEKPGGSNCMD
jgi:hypothetical protein